MSKRKQLVLIFDEPEKAVGLPAETLEKIIPDLAELIVHFYSTRKSKGGRSNDNRL